MNPSDQDPRLPQGSGEHDPASESHVSPGAEPRGNSLESPADESSRSSREDQNRGAPPAGPTQNQTPIDRGPMPPPRDLRTAPKPIRTVGDESSFVSSAEPLTEDEARIFSRTQWIWAFVGWALYLVVSIVVLSWLWNVNSALTIAVSLLFVVVARFMLGGTNYFTARALIAIIPAFGTVFGCALFSTMTTLWTADEVRAEVVSVENNQCQMSAEGRDPFEVGCPPESELSTGDQVGVLVDGWLQERPELADRFRENYTWLPYVAIGSWGAGFALRVWGVLERRREERREEERRVANKG